MGFANQLRQLHFAEDWHPRATPARKAVHKHYSTFPDGWHGFGLLLLRISLGGTLLAQGLAYLLEEKSLISGYGALCMLVVCTGASLIIGLLTPAVSTVAFLTGLGVTFLWLPAPGWNLFHGNPLSFNTIVIALAIMFLGPGAYSVDSRVFGRRKVIIPRPSQPQEP